jgi:flagellar basal-body rod modification protein FlgD
MAASLTGKQVRALSNQVHLNASEATAVQFKLNNTADEVDVIIRNASGAEVRRETMKGVASGDNSWEWDGLNNSGDRMGEGDYYVEIQAKNGDQPVGSLTFIEGVANKVRYSGEGVLLTVNGVEVPIGDVEEVGIDLF